jgi:hypothetical protein
VAVATCVAQALGLAVDDAVVINDSNRWVVHLQPCDVVARVTPVSHFASATREVELAVRLGALGGQPIGELAAVDGRPPRVHRYDDLQVSLWRPIPAAAGTVAPDAYASALAHLHEGLRQVTVEAALAEDRILATRADVSHHDVTPDLPDADRALLVDTLHRLAAVIARDDTTSPVQVLHGEPHPGNVLLDPEHRHEPDGGVRFIDFENVARGPVEYDLAWVPEAVVASYPGPVDRALLDACRGAVLAIIAAHRWRADDRHPSGRRSGVAFVDALRTGPPWPPIDDVRW